MHKVKTLIFPFAILLFVSMASASVITPSLRKRVEKGEKVTAIVKMSRATQEVLDRQQGKTFASREEKASALTKGLKAHADETQKAHRKYLDSKGVAYKSLWISNTIVVQNPTLEILEGLEALGGIAEIREEETVGLLDG